MVFVPWRLILLSGTFTGTSNRPWPTMAASLRLGRQGILFGLKLSNLNKCSRATQWQEHARHFFLSPWSLGKCCQFSIRIVFVLVCGQPRTCAILAFVSFADAPDLVKKKSHFLRLTHVSDPCRKYTGLITGFQNIYLQYTVWHQQRCPSKKCKCIDSLACTAPDLEKRSLLATWTYNLMVHKDYLRDVDRIMVY